MRFAAARALLGAVALAAAARGGTACLADPIPQGAALSTLQNGLNFGYNGQGHLLRAIATQIETHRRMERGWRNRIFRLHVLEQL